MTQKNRRNAPFIDSRCQRPGNLLLQVVDHVLNHDRNAAVIIITPELGPVITREQNTEELIGDVSDRRPVRLVKDIHVVNISAVLIILQDAVRHVLDAVADISSHKSILKIISIF